MNLQGGGDGLTHNVISLYKAIFNTTVGNDCFSDS